MPCLLETAAAVIDDGPLLGGARTSRRLKSLCAQEQSVVVMFLGTAHFTISRSDYDET